LLIYIIHGVENKALIVFKNKEDGINKVVPAQIINMQPVNVICPHQLLVILIPNKKY
jgi:hypothetical protein